MVWDKQWDMRHETWDMGHLATSLDTDVIKKLSCCPVLSFIKIVHMIEKVL